MRLAPGRRGKILHELRHAGGGACFETHAACSGASACSRTGGKTPGTPSVAPVIKDLFASASSGEMVLSNWTVAAPVKKAVAAAKNVIAEPGRKRRGGFGRFVLRLLIIIVVLLILPTVLEYIGLENISEQIRTFFDGLLNRIIG